MPRLLEKQFFGTSHIESEESDKNLHWKPVLPQPFSKEKLLFQVLEKALENNLAVTLAFSYIRNHLLEEIDELLQELEVWCQSREKEAGKDQEEIIVNDWAMPILCRENHT